MNHRSSGSLSLRKAIEGFLSFKSAEGLSDRTVDSYERLLEKWLEYQGDEEIHSHGRTLSETKTITGASAFITNWTYNGGDMRVQPGQVLDQADDALPGKFMVVGQLALGLGIRLGGGGKVDVRFQTAGAARKQGCEAQRDTPLAHLGESDRSLSAPGTGDGAFLRAQGVDRAPQVAVPLHGVPGQIQMGVEDQHYGGCLSWRICGWMVMKLYPVRVRIKISSEFGRF